MYTVMLFFFYIHNDPKFSDRYVWPNIVDPDQTAPRAVWSGSTLFAILSTSFGQTMVKPHGSNFRMIIAIFVVSQIL